MHSIAVAHHAVRRGDSAPSVLVLAGSGRCSPSACGKVAPRPRSRPTARHADPGRAISETDMDKIDGGTKTVEAAIEEHNPGLTYEGSEKDGTDTVFTMVLEFSDAKDYAAKAQKALEAGELTKTAEVTFTPPKPPFSSGYTLTRNFSEKDLTRWAVKALVDDGKIADAEEGDIDSALDPGETTVEVDGDGLEKGWGEADGADVWTNAATASFESVSVVTAGVEDPAEDSYTRTVTYELPRETISTRRTTSTPS